ncbi:hypothetical protein ACWDLG_40215 [Nonomuraea sp. NPDC003727]
MERWLTLFWMTQADQTPVLEEHWRLNLPATREQVTAGVSRLCARHEMLRSIFDIEPSGLPVRRVVPMEDFVAPTVFTDADTPFPTPEIGDAVSSGRFLWYMVFLVENDLIHEVQLYLQHIIADAAGFALWRTQMDQAIQGVDWTPQRLAKSDGGHADKSGTDSPANAHRDERLARSSQAIVPAVRSDAPHSHFQISTVLPGLAVELQRVSDAAGVSVPVAAKFLLAWAMSQLSGRSDVLLANVASTGSLNSEEIGCRISNLYELVTVRDEATFHQALSELQAESFNTYLAWEDRDYSQEVDRRARMLQRRGIGGIAPVYFDYITAVQQSAPLHNETTRPRQIVIEVGANAVDCLSPVFIFYHVNDRDIQLEIRADERVIDSDLAKDLPHILTRLTLLAQQVSLPVSAAKEFFPQKFRNRSDAISVGGRWLSPSGLKRLLAESPDVIHAEVEISGEQVAAELQLAESADIFDVHEFVTCRLFSNRTVCAPDVYFWHKPGRPARQKWTASREALPRLACETENEELLVASIQAFHRDEISNLAESYVQAGGRLLLAPAVVRRLEEHGLTGLGREHFEAPFSLRSLARLLRPSPFPVLPRARQPGSDPVEADSAQVPLFLQPPN